MAGNSDLVADKVAALRLAERMGCRGAHQHPDGKWMPCETMEEYEKLKDNRPTSQKTGLDIIEQNRRYRSRKGKKKRGWEPLGERGLTSIDTMSGGGLTGGRSGTIKALWAPTVGDTDVFSNARQARRRARELGCIGISRRRSGSGKTVWTPCSNMTDYQKRTGSTAFGRNWQRQQARRQMQSAVEREVRRQLRRKESLTEMLYAEKALGRKLRSARIATSARFDPNAVDADADAIVQEGTPFERPALPGRRLARRAQRMGRRMQARQTRRRIERDPEYPVDAPMSDSEIDRHYADWLERNPGYIDDATPHVQNMLSSRAHGAAEGLRSRRSPPDGKPSKIERAKKQILDRIKPEHRDKVERKIHWVFGSPGTGKTHLLKSGAVDAPGRDAAVHVNPDDLKPHLPGYDGPNGDSTTHMHSVAEAADLMDSAAEGGMDMVVQGTGKNNPLIARHVQDETGYGDKTVRKRKKGVTSIAHLIYGGSADTTNDRIDRRNADPHSKQRNRPFGSDRELLEERMRLADQIERGWFDEVYIYDNSANTKDPPLVAYRTKDGQFQILDRKKFNDFFGDQRHPLDPHGRTGAQRVEEAWIGQRDGTPLLSGERGRGWRPDQHFDSAIPGDGRTYREILDKLGYEEQTKKRPKPLQGPPTPRGMGYRDPDIGDEEEEENLGYFMPDGTWIPTGGSIEEENEAYRRATGMTPKTPENPTQTDIERRRREGAEERRERRGERRGGVRSSRGVDPVEDTYNYGRGLRSVKRRNEESLATLEELGGHYSWAGMTREEKLAWIDAELEKAGSKGTKLFVPSRRTGIEHFTGDDGSGRNGKDRILAALDVSLELYRAPEQRHLDRTPEATAHAERLREFVESKTPEELHALVLKWGRELYDDPDNRIAVMDSDQDLEIILGNGVYRTTHSGGLRPASDAKIRTSLEILHGYPARTPDGLRPASGFLIPGAMIRRMRADIDKEQTRTPVTDIWSHREAVNMLTQGAGSYGTNMIVLKPEVAERSRAGAGDSLNDLPSMAPLVGATDDEIVDALIAVNGGAKGGHTVEADMIRVLERVMLGLDGSSLGDPSSNPWGEEDGLMGEHGRLVGHHSYHEVLIHGSFVTGDIERIVKRSNQWTDGSDPQNLDNVPTIIKELESAIGKAKALGLSQEDIDTLQEHLTWTTGQPPRITDTTIPDEIIKGEIGQIRMTNSAQRMQGGQREQNRKRAQQLSYGEDTPLKFSYTESTPPRGGGNSGIDWEDPRTYARHYEEGDTLDDVIRKRRKESFESIAAALREPEGRGGLASKRTPWREQFDKRQAKTRAASASIVADWFEAATGEALTAEQKGLLEDAEEIRFRPAGPPRTRTELFYDRVTAYGDTYSVAMVEITEDMRKTIKSKGIRFVTDQLTKDEQRLIRDALPPSSPDDDVATSPEHLVDVMHDQWTRVAGGEDSKSLLTQLSMARMLGWSDEKIEREVFHTISKPRWDPFLQEFVPMEITYADLAKQAATVVERLDLDDRGILRGSDDPRHIKKPLIRVRLAAIERELSDLRQEEQSPRKASGIGKSLEHHEHLVIALALEHYYGESYRAVLAAEQRATANRLKEQGIETVTLYRGVTFEEGAEGGLLGDPDLLSQNEAFIEASDSGSPLTSWSISQDVALGFAKMHTGANEPNRTGYVLKSEVSVDDIVGLSTYGFGCLPEGECIVSHIGHGKRKIEVLSKHRG